MEVDAAHHILSESLNYESGRFFSGGVQLSLGVGKVYSGIRFPIYNEDSELFLTAEGIVYVLTHECDIDQNNIRPFNTHVLICPVHNFEIFVEEYQKDHSEQELVSFLSNLANRNVSRVIYLPLYDDLLPYGGLLYFNQFANTHISAFRRDNANGIRTLTNYGLRIVDQMLQNHLFRPKTELLSL